MNSIRNIKTVQKVNAVIEIPTSKSITNRALIAAALAEGVSKIIDPSPADDCRLMIGALCKFGIKIEDHKDFLLVHGSCGKLKAPESEIYVGNAGTTMRFLAALASIADGKTRLVGTERMNQRPLSELLSALDQLGVKYESNGGFTPLTVYGGKLKGGFIKINGSRSSQFISSVLLVSPYADSGVELNITDKIISKPYVNLTLDLMNDFGVEIIEKNNSFFISNKAKYQATNYIIEGDASSASYFFAAAAITCGQVRILNLKRTSRQGDTKFLDILQQMGCEVSSDDEGINVKGNNLSAISIDMSEIPDLVPTLAVVALFAKGKTSILNVKHLR
jgi:3-phosphoshikimate 1-carboxyvinyltransferase